MRGFDIVGMAQYLDWFNFMSYDIHVSRSTRLTEPRSAYKKTGNLGWRQSLHPEVRIPKPNYLLHTP